MPNWTIAFTDRTDGVIMLGDINLQMKPVNSVGSTYSTAFTSLFACYTSDNKFTVNDNAFTVDGDATITALPWTPNSKQMDIIREIPEIKNTDIFSKLN